MMKILHFSDIHMGYYSEFNNIPIKEYGDQYISILKDFISNKLSDKIDIILISGDIISKGESYVFNNPIFLSFLDYFKSFNVPIIICPGNHERDRDEKQLRKGFQSYVEFILRNKDDFKICCANDFKDNLISYYYLERENILFISMNSCVFVYNKKIQYNNAEKEEKGESQDIPGILHSHIVQIKEEIEKKYGEKSKHFNKFLICHHPLNEIKKFKASFLKLKEFGVKVVFSGHSHDFYEDEDDIINIGAGSLSSNYEALKDILNYSQKKKQFNYYEIDPARQFIIIKTAKWKKIWKITKEKRKKIPLVYSFSFKQWLDINKFNDNQKEKLRNKNILYIFSTLNKNKYLFLNNQNQMVTCYIIDKNITQLKLDDLREKIVRRLKNGEDIKDLLFVVKNPDLNYLLPYQLTI